MSYSYDSTVRLTGATDTAANSFGILAYSYDLNGNRPSETRNAGTMPYVYSPPNWLYQKGSETRPRPTGAEHLPDYVERLSGNRTLDGVGG